MDLSNIVKKDEWARTQGYSGWNNYVDMGGSEQTAQQGIRVGGGGSNIYNNYQDPVQSYLDQSTQSIVDMYAKQQNLTKDYLDKNPFALDDAWLNATRTQVQSEVNADPYYKEKLSNYIADVDTQKTRANEDQETLLKELDRQEKVYLKEDAMSFQKTREAALEGQIDTGLKDTGTGMRDKNLTDINHQVGLEDYTSQQDLRKQQAQTTTSRLLSDLATNQSRFSTDVEREKALNVQSDIQERKKESLDYWKAGFTKATGETAPGVYDYLAG